MICIQNSEAMIALNKHLVAFINDVSSANCMTEGDEMKVRSTYFVLRLVTFPADMSFLLISQ